MSTQHFISRDYSPGPDYYIPTDDDLDDEGNTQWQDYCREAARVDRTRVKECVLSVLDRDDSLLYTLIDRCLKEPQEPGRARESIILLAQMGQALLDVTAGVVDEQINMCMTGRGPR